MTFSFEFSVANFRYDPELDVLPTATLSRAKVARVNLHQEVNQWQRPTPPHRSQTGDQNDHETEAVRAGSLLVPRPTCRSPGDITAGAGPGLGLPSRWPRSFRARRT